MQPLPVSEPNAVQVFPGAISVPDVYVFVLKELSRGAAANEPQQLLCHTYIAKLASVAVHHADDVF